MKVAVGFSARFAVTVAPGLTVVDRREIRVRNGQPYHLARTEPLPEARKILDRASSEARQRMLDGINQLITDVAPNEIAAVGLVLGSFHLPSSLEALLASHPACHAAEGEMSREAVLAVSEELGLPVTGVPGREIHVSDDVEGLGKTIGPPWRKDHKLAATVAWLALR
jgi:hypothetical protein